METGPPRGPRGPPSTFVALMLGAPGSLSSPRWGPDLPTLGPWGPAIDGLSVDGGRSLISIRTCQGVHRQCFFSVDGGRSWISSTTSQGARRQHFLVLMVDARGSPSPLFRGPTVLILMMSALESPSAPPRGPTVDAFSIDGGRSLISISNHQGAPPSLSMSSNIDSGRSRISSSGTSQGAHHQRSLALMVDTPEFIASAPPRGPAVDTFYH
jgi:hypothetical protein